MDWNPKTHKYCENCPHYRARGEYIYQLERDPKLRMCRNLPICARAYKAGAAQSQVTFGGLEVRRGG